MFPSRLTWPIVGWLSSVATLVPADAPARWGRAYLSQRSEWYASAAARAVADSVLQYRSAHGGWPTSTDLATPPRTAAARGERDPRLLGSLGVGELHAGQPERGPPLS